ncbi:hypothetical protein BKA70DRAFT_1238486 [Coprinopsis sp. MPI-PUGE-AT-0042]|nr:hypothetical protein BKA70DRAFT_1238486 [Coprinopsis sp. MPI-PUGE-AT-0042]
MESGLADIRQVNGVPHSTIYMSPAEESRRRRVIQAFRVSLTIVSKEFDRRNLIRNVNFDVEARAHGEQEISATQPLDGCSRGWIYSRGLPILYSFLVFASFTLQYLHLPPQLAGTEPSPVVGRRIRALGRDCLPLLECLGVASVITQLAEDLNNCLITARLPSLQRFDVQATDTNPCVEAFVKAHGRKLVVLKADSSIRGLFSATFSNASTWIIDGDGSRSSVE